MRMRKPRHVNGPRSTTVHRGRLYVAGLAATALVLLGAASAFAALTGTGVYAPPATGSFAYNTFVPLLSAGAAYVDPVFGDAVRRLSTDHGHDDIYARNMWWSADETRYLHRTNGVAGTVDAWNVIDVATGTVTHAGIPFGSFAADGGFDPVNANVLYYLVQDRGDGHGEIHQVTLGTGGTWMDAVYFTAPAAIGELGGTLNWLDASGHYMLVRYGSEPSVHLYDRQNLTAGPYANPINASNSIDPGSYIGISPDGQYLVGYQSPPAGFGGMGQGLSWRLDHTNRAIASSPTVFWSLCGDHGSFLSASDGHNYMITYDCYSQAGLWRVDITNNAAGLNEAQQQALPNNQLLLAFPTWNDFGHVSTVARGTLRDWALVSTEDGTDTFNSGKADSSGNITPWHAYRQEIMAVNVLTGEIQRLAHHSSRSIDTDYYSQPRLSVSWGGAVVGFASNFNQPGGGTPVVDTYAVPFGAPVSTTDPLLTVTLAGTGSGTVTSSAAGISCGATCSAGYASGTAVTLTASPASGSSFAGWSGACTGTGTCTVTLTANATVTATFNTSTSASYTLTVTKAGTGSGTVTSSPAGISCGTTCSASYTSGTSVTLTATAASGSSFAGWSGACTGTGTCTVLANTNTTVSATFNTSNTSLVSVSITAPTSGATVSGKVVVSASASAAAGISSVQFKLDGANLGGKDNSAPYQVTWDTTHSSNGLHTLTAVATDKKNHKATSVPVTVTVANGASTSTTTGPVISGVSASSVSSSGVTITWTTSTASTSQVDYGTTTAYGSSTTLDTALVTTHSQTLSGLTAGTLYHYRVKSQDSAGNLSTSADYTFTTAASSSGSGGSGSLQNVVWTNVVNVTATGNSLQKTSGCDGCDDAGGFSQQQITSGNGYFEFTASETDLLRYAGLTNGAAGSGEAAINFAIRLQSGYASVTENGTYQADTTFTTGDVFRVAVESGVVNYYKNGTLFYTSTAAPVYPLQGDAALLNLNSTVTNAVISF